MSGGDRRGGRKEVKKSQGKGGGVIGVQEGLGRGVEREGSEEKEGKGKDGERGMERGERRMGEGVTNVRREIGRKNRPA